MGIRQTSVCAWAEKVLQDMGNYTVEGPGEMCYAVFWVRGPACDTKRPLRGNDLSEMPPTGRWPHAAAAKTVIDFGEIIDPFIACATGAALPVAMRAASRPA